MKRVALLIDGGWFSKGLGIQLNLPGKWPTAEQVCRNAKSILTADEEIFRIFYYDCEPFGKTVTNPIDGSSLDFTLKPTFTSRRAFFADLGQRENVALRRGELKARGWELSDSYKKNLMSGAPATTLGPTDVYPALQQKGVDMRIGIDVAMLALKKIVERIILFSGDMDMIPAIKLARREGIQIFLVKLGRWPLQAHLVEDADGVRSLTPVV
ncbi:MAG: NYN domain-containing protein [Methylacidiphilales bacterium]|nr:NYN domain-containing protein [Candidatus Methylacidiphilales bacterium]